MHRIGGGSVENLRLKPAEETLPPPGISVLGGGTPAEAAAQIRSAFPGAANLQALAEWVGSATVEDIHKAGFEVRPDPTRRFVNHCRIVHPDGVAGFGEPNLTVLSRTFVNTRVERS